MVLSKLFSFIRRALSRTDVTEVKWPSQNLPPASKLPAPTRCPPAPSFKQPKALPSTAQATSVNTVVTDALTLALFIEAQSSPIAQALEPSNYCEPAPTFDPAPTCQPDPTPDAGGGTFDGGGATADW